MNAQTSGSPHDTDDVSAALHLLGESLHGEVQRINSDGPQAMQSGDNDAAQAVTDFPKRLTADSPDLLAIIKQEGRV